MKSIEYSLSPLQFVLWIDIELDFQTKFSSDNKRTQIGMQLKVWNVSTKYCICLIRTLHKFTQADAFRLIRFNQTIEGGVSEEAQDVCCQF